jgi:quercetin dioxygenase-like cupin family protein
VNEHRIEVSRWSEHSRQPLTEARVRERYVPASNYRISSFRYPAGTAFGASMRAGTCYVLAGTCRFRFGADEVALRAGDVARLPEGTYALEAGPGEELHLIKVWELPEAFRPPG